MTKVKELDPIAIGIKKKIAEKGILKKSVAFRAGFTEQQFSDMLNGRRIIKAPESDLVQRDRGHQSGCISETEQDSGIAQGVRGSVESFTKILNCHV